MDLKEMIMAELKKSGLDIAEDAAVAVVKAMFVLFPKIVIATENKYDDLLLAVLPVLEPKVMELLDKIDGQEG